jgi:hypothetical protein
VRAELPEIARQCRVHARTGARFLTRRSRLLGISVLGALALAGTAQATTVVDTTGSWDGSTGVCPFGSPNTATIGQVVTAPSQDTVLDSFSFYMRALGSPAPTTTLTFRGEIYAWDGLKATGPNLWESAPRTLVLSAPYQEVTFPTGGVQLVGGNQYVLFASISKDFEQNAIYSWACWGFVGADVYSGGDLRATNDSGDESRWTSTHWDYVNLESAFKASFVAPPLPTSKEQCKSDGWRRFGGFKNQGDCVSFVQTEGGNRPSGT